MNTPLNSKLLDSSGRRIVVDPVTRIEGHMRCEVNVDDNNIIRNAVSTGTMWRGLEVILKGRDPRDAWSALSPARVVTVDRTRATLSSRPR